MRWSTLDPCSMRGANRAHFAGDEAPNYRRRSVAECSTLVTLGSSTFTPAAGLQMLAMSSLWFAPCCRLNWRSRQHRRSIEHHTSSVSLSAPQRRRARRSYAIRASRCTAAVQHREAPRRAAVSDKRRALPHRLLSPVAWPCVIGPCPGPRNRPAVSKQPHTIGVTGRASCKSLQHRQRRPRRAGTSLD